MGAASMYLTIASTAMQVVGSIQKASADKSASDYNAALSLRNADAARQQAAMDAEKQGRDARRQIGAMRAGYGASGVTGEGSPLDVLESSAAGAELDRQTILYKGNVRAMGYEGDAALETARGKNAMKEGYMGAASSLLTGGAKYYSSRPGASLVGEARPGQYSLSNPAYG